MCKPLGIIASCVALSCAATFASALEIPGPAKHEMLPLALRGVHFVPNHGQWTDGSVYFGLRSRGLDIAFRESAFTMHLARQAGSDSLDREDALAPSLDAPRPDQSDSVGDQAEYEHLTLTVSFPGSNSVVPEGDKPQTAKFNYFVGGEGRGVASDVPSFGAIVYHNLYDGVDLHVMGSDDGVLKYEFHVAPGADYGPIRISYDGIESLCIDESGNLRIATAFGTLADEAPVVWQDIEGERCSLAAQFELLDSHTHTVALLDSPNPTLPLAIDPNVQWMVYLGGSGQDESLGSAIDVLGNVYITGQTRSADFEGRNNERHSAEDAFVAKVSPVGDVLWMTYLGGSSGEYGYDIDVNVEGSAFVTGETDSLDFGGRLNSNHGETDAFVAKVSGTGIVEWATYLGGAGRDIAFGMASGTDCLILVGQTASSDFEDRTNAHHGGFWDAFVLKLDYSGTVDWMRYLGGSGGTDRGAGVDVVGNDVFVAGGTNSTDFEGRNNSYQGGNYDGFVAHVDSGGILLWMAYLGGSRDESASSILADGKSVVLVAGYSASPDFEGRRNAHHGNEDGYIAMLNRQGRVQWMLYIGGSETDSCDYLALDGTGHVFVGGTTWSSDLSDRRNSHRGGGEDVFLGKVNVTGVPHWTLYIGGSGYEYCAGIDVDNTGGVVLAGYTTSTDFDGHINAHHGGFEDAFVVSLRVGGELELDLVATCPSGGKVRVSWSNATPDARVALIFARNTGDFIVPAGYPCQGTQLGLGTSFIQLVGNYSAGENGERTINGFAGNGACGGHLQLLDLSTCGTSNVVRIE